MKLIWDIQRRQGAVDYQVYRTFEKSLNSPLGAGSVSQSSFTTALTAMAFNQFVKHARTEPSFSSLLFFSRRHSATGTS